MATSILLLDDAKRACELWNYGNLGHVESSIGSKDRSFKVCFWPSDWLKKTARGIEWQNSLFSKRAAGQVNKRGS